MEDQQPQLVNEPEELTEMKAGTEDMTPEEKHSLLMEKLDALDLDPLKHRLIKEKIEEEKELSKPHDFWDTLPVKKRGLLEKEGIINHLKVEDILTDPYTLPGGYRWAEVDISNLEELEELLVFLRDNYVEDKSAHFRFDYQCEFLKWAMDVPNGHPEWLLAVRGGKNDKMFGFISGVPIKLRTRKLETLMCEINFLCVHKKLRTKRLAPVLIKEITRRVNLKGIFLAVYTSGSLFPQPFGKCRYYHRNINVKKLIDCKFSYLPLGRTMGVHKKLLKILDEPTVNCRLMQAKDVSAVRNLYADYTAKFDVSFIFNKAEIKHLLMPRDKVMSTYVVENDDGLVTDFFSFYSLPSTVLQNDDYDLINACFSYYNVATSMPMTELIKNALIMALKEGYDVYNCLDLMDNSDVFEELKFGKGSGNLYYYLYNFLMNDVAPNKLSLVLV